MSNIDRSNYPGIPVDFPIEVQDFALAGDRPKLSLVKQGETYYASGTSPQEVQEDYEEMRDLAQQMAAFFTIEGQTTESALEQMLAREAHDMQFHFGIRPCHSTWVVKRVRALLLEAGHPAAVASSSAQ